MKFQYLGNMLKMKFLRLTVDEDVLKKYEDKGLVIRFQYVIHEDLEGGVNIYESKGNN